MKVYNFIDEQIHKSAEIEITEQFSPEKAKEIIDRLNILHLDPEGLDFDEFHEQITNDPDLSELPELKSVLYFFQKSDDLEYSLEDFQKLNELLTQSPKNRLYKLVWLLYKIYILQNEEHYFAQRTEFIDSVLSENKDLIELEDFFESTEILQLLWPLSESNLHDLLLPLLNKAIIMFPEKIVLDYYLGMVFYFKEDFKTALKHFNNARSFILGNCTNLEDIKYDAYSFYEYLDMQQYLAYCNYRTGDIVNCEKFVDYVLSHLPVVYGPDDDEGIEDVYSYIETFILRMHLDIKNKDFIKLQETYNRVKGQFGIQEINPEFTALTEYINSLKD